MAELSAEDAQSLVRAIVDLAGMAERALPTATGFAAQLRDHIGIADDDPVPNTSTSIGMIERANLQVALNELEAAASAWDERGLPSEIGNYGGVSLAAMADGSFRGPTQGPRQFVSVDISTDMTIRCLRAGLILAVVAGTPVALMVYETERHRPAITIEVAAPSQDAAESTLDQLRSLMHEHNVLRGKVLTFSFGEYGDFGLDFATIPPVARSEVILPAEQLAAIEAHALGITEQADALTAAGQHLKRGLLLYGPPGTGKTHTVSYLLTQMPDRTAIVLTGGSVGAIGQAGTLARKLAPATIVVEDVDLIGSDRGLPGGEHNPLLFQLLNEMDGLQADDDVLFILTTNRADLLEPALAARPGRIDQAIEIGPPDHDGRRALFDLYLPEPIDDATLAQACDQTDGVAAAFIKEAARRATLASLKADQPLADAVLTVCDALLNSTTSLLRASLAVAPTHPAPPVAEHEGPHPVAGFATDPDPRSEHSTTGTSGHPRRVVRYRVRRLGRPCAQRRRPVLPSHNCH